MPPVTLIFGLLPPLVSEILREAISAQERISIIGEAHSEEQLLAMARRIGPDVIVTSGHSGAGYPLHHERLLHEFPDLTIFALAHDASHWTGLELRIYRTRNRDFSPSDLVQAILVAAPLMDRPIVVPDVRPDAGDSPPAIGAAGE